MNLILRDIDSHIVDKIDKLAKEKIYQGMNF